MTPPLIVVLHTEEIPGGAVVDRPDMRGRHGGGLHCDAYYGA